MSEDLDDLEDEVSDLEYESVPRRNLVPLLLFVVGIVCIIGIASVWLLNPPAQEPITPAEKVVIDYGASYIVPIPPVTGNIADRGKGARFITLRVVAETYSPDSKQIAERNMPRIMSAMNTYLISIPLTSATGQGSTQRIKSDLVEILGPLFDGTLKDVLIQELLVQ